MKTIINVKSFGEYVDSYINLLIDYSPKLVTAFLILFIGLYAIRFFSRLLRKILQKREVDQTLAEFLSDLLLWGMRLLLFVTFISNLGVETTSFVAILGAVGLAVGMSLQGSLSNLAGGVLIVLFKPFRVGDVIEAQGVNGTVQDIQIFVTKLRTLNNQTVFIPNGILSNGTIVNYSLHGIRRADMALALPHQVDLHKAKSIIMEVLAKNPRVLSQPAPFVGVKTIAETSVVMAIQPWSTNEDYVAMCAEVLESCKTNLSASGSFE